MKTTKKIRLHYSKLCYQDCEKLNWRGVLNPQTYVRTLNDKIVAVNNREHEIFESKLDLLNIRLCSRCWFYDDANEKVGYVKTKVRNKHGNEVTLYQYSFVEEYDEDLSYI